MASLEEVAFIRNARAGNESAQLELGRRYLFGGTGLKRNLLTSLYWLQRAANKSVAEAWLLIGTHVPYETAISSPDPLQLCVWYERAFNAGIVHAGLVWARLVLKQIDGATEHPLYRKALKVLEKVADTGVSEAQWILARELTQSTALVSHQADEAPEPGRPNKLRELSDAAARTWAERAANNGVLPAQYALAEFAWTTQDHADFIRWALPVARSIVLRCGSSDITHQLAPEEVTLLSRCGRLLIVSDQSSANEAKKFLILASKKDDKEARFSLGIWYANMDDAGNRVRNPSKRSDFRKAISWLTLAGEQGLAKAWYVLYRICLRPNIWMSQQLARRPQRYLELAAEGGHCIAQLNLGIRLWRKRANDETYDTLAVRWLQRAAFQGSTKAKIVLRKIAARAPALWTQEAEQKLTTELRSAYPLLAARIRLAAVFGLSTPEALLVNPAMADQGHCLLIDIRNQYAKAKRRLILIETAAERNALNQVLSCFENIDCSATGPEGNYRKRLYLFKKLFSAPKSPAQA